MKVTLLILSLLIVIFLVQAADPQITSQLELVSGELFQRPWTLITYSLVHADALHILYNGIGLAIFGLILEEQIGSKKFISLFMASALIAGIAAAIIYPATLGASGAVFGIIGALAVLRPLMVVWVSYIPMPMFLAAAVWAAGDFLGIIMPSNIANVAHLAGLATGIVGGFLMRQKKQKKGKEERIKIADSELDAWERTYMRQK